MKHTWLLVATCALLLAGPARAATPALPADSVYQLPLVLEDQHGGRRDWRAHRGTPQVVAMFYTSCTVTCPLVVDSGKAIEHALGPVRSRGLGLLLISFDPARDTPAALRRVAVARHLDGTRWSLARPRPADVRAVAGVLGVRYRQRPDGEFNHTSGLVLLDRDGRIVARTGRIGAVADPVFVRAVERTLDH